MKKLKHYLTASIGLILFVSVIALSLPQNGHSNFAPDKDVRVINTTAEPIPVVAQGTTNVAVQNTPTVNAKQSGVWNVGIAGTPTVEVGNAAANPVFVRDVNDKPQTPYQAEVEVNLAENQGGGNGFITVPAGKIFVVEQVSAIGFAPTGQILQFSVGTRILPDSIRREHYLQTTKEENDALTNKFTASQMVKIYAYVASVSVRVTRNLANDTAVGRFTVSGYFVDK